MGNVDSPSVGDEVDEQNNAESDEAEQRDAAASSSSSSAPKYRDASAPRSVVGNDAGVTQSEPAASEDKNSTSTQTGKPSSDAGTTPAPTTTTTPTTTTADSTPKGGAASVYKVKDGKIFDGCGEELVMRGVNHPTIYNDREGAAFPEIAKTGANTVRLWWYGLHGVAPSELEKPVSTAVKNGLLPIIEMHDSTCAWNVAPIVDAWLKSDMVALIKKHEKHLIVNIANEASYPNGDEFVKTYKDAVSRMRAAGIHTPLMIDGGRCGRDYDTLLNRGKELLDADPDHNLIFSAHLYDPLAASAYTSMFAKAKSMQLPFIVGEFANKEPPGCGKNIDYSSLIGEANKAGIGWLAWSWGDNDPNGVYNTDCGEFDMTKTFSYDSLFAWGKDVSVDNAASIQKTSKRPYALQHADQCK